jgi:hypothetical protein
MATKKVSRTKNAGRIVYTLGKGGPSLFDLRTNTREVILLVTGPGMVFDHLEVLTTLSAAAGATAKAWQAFTKGIDCVDPQVTALLTGFTATPVRKVSDVLDPIAVGYDYA